MSEDKFLSNMAYRLMCDLFESAKNHGWFYDTEKDAIFIQVPKYFYIRYCEYFDYKNLEKVFHCGIPVIMGYENKLVLFHIKSPENEDLKVTINL